MTNLKSSQAEYGTPPDWNWVRTFGGSAGADIYVIQELDMAEHTVVLLDETNSQAKAMESPGTIGDYLIPNAIARSMTIMKI